MRLPKKTWTLLVTLVKGQQYKSRKRVWKDYWYEVKRGVRNHPVIRRLQGKPRFVPWEEHGTLTATIVDTYKRSYSPWNAYGPPGRTVHSYGAHSANHEEVWEDAQKVANMLNEIDKLSNVNVYEFIQDTLWNSEKGGLLK